MFNLFNPFSWFRKTPQQLDKESNNVMSAFSKALTKYIKINSKIVIESDKLSEEIDELYAQANQKALRQDELEQLANRNSRMIAKLNDFINN